MITLRGSAVVDGEDVQCVVVEGWTDYIEDVDIFGYVYRSAGLSHGPFVTVKGPVSEKLFRKIGEKVVVWFESPKEVTEPMLARLVKIENFGIAGQ
jgi:hypothetical protein